MIKFGISNLGVFVMCLESARGPDISATPYPRLAAKNLLAKLACKTCLQTFPFSSRGNILLDRICTQPTKKISEKP